MVKQKVVVKNLTGLHLRPAGLLCKEAINFKCSIHFQFHDTYANAKERAERAERMREMRG